MWLTPLIVVLSHRILPLFLSNCLNRHGQQKESFPTKELLQSWQLNISIFQVRGRQASNIIMHACKPMHETSCYIWWYDPGISLDKIEFKTDGRILGEASLDVDPKLKVRMYDDEKPQWLLLCLIRNISIHIQLWVSAEDGRQDAGKPIRSHGKLGFEYINQGVIAAQSEVCMACLYLWRWWWWWWWWWSNWWIPWYLIRLM